MELQRVRHDWETQQLPSPHLGLSPSLLTPCRPRLQQELEPQEGTSPWAALAPLGFAELWYEPSKVYAQPACWLFLKTCSWMSCVLNFRVQEEMGQAERICTTAQKRCGLTPAPSRVSEEIWHGCKCCEDISSTTNQTQQACLFSHHTVEAFPGRDSSLLIFRSSGLGTASGSE